MTLEKALVVFGGTFDPIHNGHLKSSIAIKELLGVEVVKLVPCQIPPHRSSPSTTPEHRLEMLRIATEALGGIEVDERELRRTGPSFTYDTLKSYREELGAEVPLILVMGSDAFVTLAEWYRWREICELAHLVVLNRPYGSDREASDVLCKWMEDKLCDDPGALVKTAAGKICPLKLVQVPVSATRIRELYGQGGDLDDLVPDEVNRYIKTEQLYLNDTGALSGSQKQ